MTATLWVSGPLPGMNELVAAAKGAGGRGYLYAVMKREWTDAVCMLAKAARLPKFTCVLMHFQWREKGRRRDPDNIAAGGRKLVLDGLVKAGVLPGDGWKHVASWTDSFITPPGGPYGVLVTLEQVE